MILDKDEVLEDILIDDIKIIQNKNLYRFTSDSVILSKFASFKKNDKVADFCSGSGIVGLHYYALHKNLKEAHLFEIQKELADMSQKTVEYNNLEKVFKVHNCKVQDIPKEYNGYFNLITCNPPYKKCLTGEKNEATHIAICRHEVEITMKEIIEIASKKLQFGGRFCICQRIERFSECMCLLKENGLEPSKLQFVTKDIEKEPYLFLLEATKGVHPALKVLVNYVNK